jgi:hypothetical protein
MPRIHFLTFGDGSPELRGAASRLRQQARHTDLFQSIHAHTLLTIKDQFPEFWLAHSQFLLSNKRGLGYWLWKPFLISEALKALPENDFLMYADAGCELFPGRNMEILNVLPSEPPMIMTVTRLEGFTVQEWTNSYTLRRIAGPDAPRCMPLEQIQSGFLIISSTAESRALMQHWVDCCLLDEYACLVDRPDEDESPSFVEHRYEQSVLTLVLYLRASEGEIKFLSANLLNEPGGFPFWTVRNRTRVSAQRTTVHYQTLMRCILTNAHTLLGSQRRYESRLKIPFAGTSKRQSGA